MFVDEIRGNLTKGRYTVPHTARWMYVAPHVNYLNDMKLQEAFATRNNETDHSRVCSRPNIATGAVHGTYWYVNTSIRAGEKVPRPFEN